jgi:hypothetical protein
MQNQVNSQYISTFSVSYMSILTKRERYGHSASGSLMLTVLGMWVDSGCVEGDRIMQFMFTVNWQIWQYLSESGTEIGSRAHC